MRIAERPSPIHIVRALTRCRQSVQTSHKFNVVSQSGAKSIKLCDKLQCLAMVIARFLQKNGLQNFIDLDGLPLCLQTSSCAVAGGTSAYIEFVKKSTDTKQITILGQFVCKAMEYADIPLCTEEGTV